MTEIWLFVYFDGVAYISKPTLASVFHCQHRGLLVMSSNVTSFQCLLHILSISERNPCRNWKGQLQSLWNFQIVFQSVDPSTPSVHNAWTKQKILLMHNIPTLSLTSHCFLYSPHIVIHIFVSVVMTTEKPDLTAAEKWEQGGNLCLSWFCQLTVTRSHINQPHPVDKGRVQN